MAARKRIARRARACGFDYREIVVLHPRARYEKYGLQKLVQRAAEEPREEKPEAPFLVEAPYNHDTDKHEYRLLAKERNKTEQRVEKRSPDGFQQP